MIALSAVIIRQLMFHNLDSTALLYVGVPFLIANLLLWFKPVQFGQSWGQVYASHMLSSLIIMLCTSIVLFEGFICVLFFMPIYIVIVSIVFLIGWLTDKYKKKKQDHKIYSNILPLIIIISSLEGVRPEISYKRHNEVSTTQIINNSVAEIKQKLSSQIELNKNDNWLLSVFPMPYKIEAGSLNQGDIHEIYFRYKRWFVTNTHHGSMSLKLVKVEDQYIETEFISNNSYISNYLNLKGTHIHFKPISDDQTEVSLTIKYDRLLDPAWYFDPLQKYAIKKTSEMLIAEVMTP
jgi:hypothetical protein